MADQDEKPNRLSIGDWWVGDYGRVFKWDGSRWEDTGYDLSDFPAIDRTLRSDAPPSVQRMKGAIFLSKDQLIMVPDPKGPPGSYTMTNAAAVSFDQYVPMTTAMGLLNALKDARAALLKLEPNGEEWVSEACQAAAEAIEEVGG